MSSGQSVCVPYDPTIYQGTAAYYARGRPPYSRALVSTLVAELGLDGSGRLFDVGCGPGTLTIELAAIFDEAIGLDPDAEMLMEGKRRARETGAQNIHWIQALAEQIPDLDLGSFRLVTFGQSFHWTDRERVAEAVFELLEPGGAIALIAPSDEDRPVPSGPGHPPIPHEAVRGLIHRYLGFRRRAGQGFASPPPDRYEDALARTRFGPPKVSYAPGRADIVQDIDGVLANYFSMSFCAPHLFGDRLEAFEAEVRAELAQRSPSGLFWDWPGDTAILSSRKPL
jgi:ubiquinone/menaquinone biosynthesis C-methylase UbiE